MSEKRAKQVSHSEQQAAMLDETSHRRKAGKIASVLGHFLARDCVRAAPSRHWLLRRDRQRAAQAGRDGDRGRHGRARADKAQARYSDRISFLCTDGQKLPIATGTVDVVVLNHIYEHVMHPEVLAAEVTCVLAPKGSPTSGSATGSG